jgi:hypothetical protein
MAENLIGENIHILEFLDAVSLEQNDNKLRETTLGHLSVTLHENANVIL